MINESYQNYLDCLCKDHVITEKQYNNALNIYYFNYDKNKWERSK